MDGYYELKGVPQPPKGRRPTARGKVKGPTKRSAAAAAKKRARFEAGEAKRLHKLNEIKPKVKRKRKKSTKPRKPRQRRGRKPRRRRRKPRDRAERRRKGRGSMLRLLRRAVAVLKRMGSRRSTTMRNHGYTRSGKGGRTGRAGYHR